MKLPAINFSPYSISPLNESALLVSFESVIDEIIHKKVMALQQALGSYSFEGYIESVPAYSSLAVFYDIPVVKKNSGSGATTFGWVKTFMEQLIAGIATAVDEVNSEIIRIPVYYNGEDLPGIARQRQLSVEDVIAIHTAKIYRVFMIGFLPGFAYMGKVDERIAAPRHASPRLDVIAGSVGIAGFQTGIYPLRSPGGWQLLGQTPVRIFDPGKKQPCLLKAGDHVQFIAISQQEFEKLNEY